jgi:acetyl esterase
MYRGEVQVTELDPAYTKASALAKAAGVEPADPLKTPLPEARAAQDRYLAFLAQDPPGVAAVRDFELQGPAGAFATRIYYPNTQATLPVIVFVRGAGWWAGSLASHDRTMRLLANESGMAVCGVDYHRAPEAHYPTQLNEVLETVRWLRSEGSALNVDARSIVLAGESAGANLCALAATRMKSQGSHPVRGLALFYGNYALPGPEARAYSKWVWTQYLGCELDRADPAAIPLNADVAGLPPAWLAVGEADPLLNDTMRFAKKLRAAGVACEVKTYPGLPHAFVMLNRVFDRAKAAVRDLAAAARRFVA